MNEVNSLSKLLFRAKLINEETRDDLYYISMVLRHDSFLRIMKAHFLPLEKQLRFFRKTYYTRSSLIETFGNARRADIVLAMLNGIENEDNFDAKKESDARAAFNYENKPHRLERLRKYRAMTNDKNKK